MKMMRNKKMGLVALVIAALLVSSVSAILLMDWAGFYRLNYEGPPKAVASTTLKEYTFGGFTYGGQYVEFVDSNVITVNTIAPITVHFCVWDADLSGLAFFPEILIGYAGDWKGITGVGTGSEVTFGVSGSPSYTFDIVIRATAKYYATVDEAGFIYIAAAVTTPP
jgi:hypothetical protein